ncbi:hypothetical protein [Emticicia sp.]|uniref:hypothetical protein n=1 Tax=Emticicia sp. TaxID=1930953 RepID=UPI003751C988
MNDCSKSIIDYSNNNHENILGNNIFQSISRPTLVGVEDVNGNVCFRITGKYLAEGSVDIWITKKDFLIYKIEIDNKVSDFRVKSTYQFFPYHIKGFNSNLFEFKPNRKVKL